MPINVKNQHWVLAVLDMRGKTLIMYDSLLPLVDRTFHNESLRLLLSYFSLECNTKRAFNFPEEEWNTSIAEVCVKEEVIAVPLTASCCRSAVLIANQILFSLVLCRTHHNKALVEIVASLFASTWSVWAETLHLLLAMMFQCSGI